MKPKMNLAPDDLAAPTRDDILKIMAELRQACESDPTLERLWMMEMAKYMFHIVGDWHEKVSTGYREMEEKVERLEQQITAIYNENRIRLNNQELSINLCLNVTNRVFDMHTKREQENGQQKVDGAGGSASGIGG